MTTQMSFEKSLLRDVIFYFFQNEKESEEENHIHL